MGKHPLSKVASISICISSAKMKMVKLLSANRKELWIMSVAELLESAQFVVDAQGNRKAVMLDFALWSEVLQLLQQLEELEEEQEDVRAIREIEARLAAGQEQTYSHKEVWAEIDRLESEGALPD
jgi:hypothetical protein